MFQLSLVRARAGITPGLKKIPSAVLWGYFAYLSLASLPGSQFWERFLLLFVDPKLRPPKYAPVACLYKVGASEKKIWIQENLL